MVISGIVVLLALLLLLDYICMLEHELKRLKSKMDDYEYEVASLKSLLKQSLQSTQEDLK